MQVLQLQVISKHFMFKVHLSGAAKKDGNKLFQNISCLRFIDKMMALDVASDRNFKTFHV